MSNSSVLRYYEDLISDFWDYSSVSRHADAGTHVMFIFRQETNTQMLRKRVFQFRWSSLFTLSLNIYKRLYIRILRSCVCVDKRCSASPHALYLTDSFGKQWTLELWIQMCSGVFISSWLSRYYTAGGREEVWVLGSVPLLWFHVFDLQQDWM